MSLKLQRWLVFYWDLVSDSTYYVYKTKRTILSIAMIRTSVNQIGLFFPQLELILGEVEYLDRCTKRTRSVVNFSRGEEFFESIPIGPLSSIPRWKYARKLSERGAEPGASRTIDALSTLLESTRTIAKGENYTVEHFVNREENQDRIRLSIYASMMRTALYLSEKNGLAIQCQHIPFRLGLVVILVIYLLIHKLYYFSHVRILCSFTVFHTPAHFGCLRAAGYPRKMRLSNVVSSPAVGHPGWSWKYSIRLRK